MEDFDMDKCKALYQEWNNDTPTNSIHPSPSRGENVSRVSISLYTIVASV